MASSSLCSVLDCSKPVRARGLCPAHYKRLWRNGSPTAGRIPQGNAYRYLDEVVLKNNEDHCLVWPYGRDSSGYGRVWNNGKAENVCRIVCENVHGKPPSPIHQAAHSCGNGHLGCVARLHIFWKTPVENGADKILHGTVYRGGRKPASDYHLKRER